MKSGTKLAIVILNALFGLYFLNSQLNFFTWPESLPKADIWITFIGGCFLILSAIIIATIRTPKYYDPRYKHR